MNSGPIRFSSTPPRDRTTSTAGPTSWALIVFGLITVASVVPATVDPVLLTPFWYIAGPLTVLTVYLVYRTVATRSPGSARPIAVTVIALVVLVATLGVGGVSQNISYADTALGLTLAASGTLVRSRYLIVTGLITAGLAMAVLLLDLQPRDPLVAATSGITLLVGGLVAARAERVVPTTRGSFR